ncbi:unnamed protein product [Ilex paraguariensis]|uniref:CASP-like protein n=1 Tax=Ilex paraguariensis TaxID=185542 RepID=A0ABC8TK73_9AQUA
MNSVKMPALVENGLGGLCRTFMASDFSSTIISSFEILAYLLISASSSAATRVVDWVSNWGKDEFTEMASASIGMSFLAFIAFALSSLISGYNLCNSNST